MTRTYCVLGLGLMGTAISYDLLSHDKGCNVIGIEASSKRINDVSQRLNQFDENFETYNLKLGEDEAKISKLLQKADVAFGAIDYKYNLELTELCIRTKTHFLDLGGNPMIVRRQQNLTDRALEAGITVIPDCGLAPGMVNILAANIIEEFDNPDEAHIRVGGLPQNPTGILQYQQVFSIRGLTNEYKEEATVIKNGQQTTVKSLTGIESIKFPKPFDDLEAFHTAGGTSSLPEIFEGKINELTYKTIRYSGHAKIFQFLSEYGFLSDEHIFTTDYSLREMTEHQLVKYLPKGKPDVVLARIFVCGEKNERYVYKTLDLIDYYDAKTNFTAMARTTAFPISIIGQFIARGFIQERGVRPGELIVPYDRFLEELAKREIIFNEKTD